MSGFGPQFVAQLRKNIWRKWRNKQVLVQEIFMPVYFILLLAMIKWLVKPKTHPEETLTETPLSNFTLPSGTVLVYPNSTLANQIMHRVNFLSSNSLNFQILNSESEAENVYRTQGSSALGITFDGYNYSLRLPYNPSLSTRNPFGSDGWCRDNAEDVDKCPTHSYLSTGLISLQSLVNQAIIQVHTSSSWTNFSTPNVNILRIPKQEWVERGGLNFLQIFSSIYYVLAFSFLILGLIVALVSEKETKSKETMSIMGLQTAAYWMSFLVLYVGMIVIVVSVVMGLTFGAKLIEKSDAGLLFLLFFLYAASIITFSFMLSTFFSKVKIAAIVGSFSTQILSMLYLVMALTRDYTEFTPDGSPKSSIPLSVQWILSLISPVAFAQGIDVILLKDFIADGVHMDNLDVGQFPVWASLMMLAIDTVLYFLLAMYFDNVLPNEYGTRQSPCFCFLPSFWCDKSSKDRRVSDSGWDNPAMDGDQMGHPDLEPVGSELHGKQSIRISHIQKSFTGCRKATVNAVNGFSLDIYEGQITALLGHNGAGKSTLINMLTGLTEPTSGRATIYGHDVSDGVELRKIRTMVGLCPQRDVLYQELTPYEHLYMYGMMKGIKSSELEAKIKEVLKQVDLEEKSRAFSKQLSGGQKRKLSVAIALIGNPKILLLDEPTAGMDPFSRRKLWSLLRSSAANRTILLTTHFMDEADILADRKAFISRGKLRCCGSSLFLKNRFGVGYHLQMTCNRAISSPSEIAPITELVQKHVIGAEVERIHGQEISFSLPLDQVTVFAGLFKSLEQDDGSDTTAVTLGIASYGVSMTSLEEVFLKLEDNEIQEAEGEEDDASMRELIKKSSTPVVRPTSRTDVAMSIAETGQNGKEMALHVNVGRSMAPPTTLSVGKVNMKLQRIRAMLTIKFLLLIRTPSNVFYRLFMPMVLLLPGVILLRNLPTSADSQNPVSLGLFPAGAYVDYSSNPKTPGYLFKDQQNNTLSNTLRAVYNSTGMQLDSFNNSADLLATKPHYLGLSVNSIQAASTTPQGVQSSFTVLYNDSAVTSLPSAIHFMYSGLMTMASGIPLPLASIRAWPALSASFQGMSVFGPVIMVGMTLTMMAGSFAADIVKDKEIGVRTLLRLTGVTSSLYWSMSFLADFIQYLIIFILVIILLIASQAPGFDSGGAILTIIVIALVYIVCVLLLSYCFAFAYKEYEKALSSLPMIFSFTSFLPYIAVAVLDNDNTEAIAGTLSTVFCFVDPPFAVYGGLHHISKLLSKYQALNGEGSKPPVSEFFLWENNIVPAWLGPLVWIPFLWLLLRILEVTKTGGALRDVCSSAQNLSTWKVSEKNLDQVEDEDEDVRDERQKVESEITSSSNASSTSAVAMLGLRKEFAVEEPIKDSDLPKKKGMCAKQVEKKRKVVVRNMSLGVPAGQVFGLLGPNGAGKSTTLNMVIADVPPTNGKVMISGIEVQSAVSEAYQNMGYCPQTDALWELLTLREHIKIFAMLQGVPIPQLDSTAEFYEEGLQIQEHRHKKVKALSGGTKRKLSYAISMLGDPRIVLLDEPSTGMDPKSKRFLWDTISEAFNSDRRGAILTTHYMEEADALCSRIGIMVNGELRCVGTSQHLKSRFGSGYVLELKLSRECPDPQMAMSHLLEELKRLFENIQETERFGLRVIFAIPNEDVTSLSAAFNLLEQAKTEYNVEEYSFSQSTLEQVFLKFAKEQKDEGIFADDAKESPVSRYGSIITPDVGPV